MKAWKPLPLLRYLGIASVLIVTAFTQMSCESSIDQYNKNGYASKFGVMAQGNDGVYRVFAETTLIHRRVDPTYVHGFEVKRKDKQRFMGFFEIRFPEPITITPEIEKAYHVFEGGQLIRSQSKIHWTTYSSPFWFSEDDPLGTYQMTIYIDGDAYRSVEYEVVKFGYDEIEF